MRSALRRADGLVRRYRVDRRLPPPVRSLYQRTLRARRRDSVAATAASVKPVLAWSGTTSSEGASVARLDDRRVLTAGPLDRSTDALALDVAARVVGALEEAGLSLFVVDRDNDQVIVGLDYDERLGAMEALARLHTDGWFLRWQGGSSSGLVPLADAAKSRAVARARTWTVFWSHSIGDLATGDEAGVAIAFWTLGSSGQLELVGTRGHQRFDPRSAASTLELGGRAFPGRTAFPVGSSLERFHGEIDLVYTWVDGSDPAWIESFRETAEACGRSVDEAALDPARFRSRDELRYSLRSVWMYCGWVRRIWVVTAGQRPDWLADDPRVTVVDHADILPVDGLPTFNSHAIEASLHHIDGLAEHLVYFNDDMFVARPLRPEVFFHANGLPKVFQSGARVPAVEDEHTEAVDTAAIRGRELLAERFGRVVESKPYHSPYPLLRSVMAEVEAEFPDIVGATRRSRFRSPSDLSTAASFSQHYALATRRATLGAIDTDYVHVESGRLGWHLDAIRLGRDVDTCCINETRNDAPGRDAREASIRSFFDQMYPIPAPWEKATDG